MRDLKTQVFGWTTALALALAPVTANARLSEPSTDATEQTEQAEQPTAEPPVEGPSPDAEGPERSEAPPAEGPQKGPILRKAGIGVMAAGGVAAAVGLSLTIAYTVRGDLLEEAAEPELARVEHMNNMAQIGGISLVSGLALVAIGGIIHARGKAEPDSRRVAHLRFTPALGGVVISGRF